ncbi:hypothetical protein OIO90_006582 [Microbotryomycetes sp. JL221]|nr:hypothetical protein OIO90_006582 [Microbotryomycetes sp. JL221]
MAPTTPVTMGDSSLRRQRSLAQPTPGPSLIMHHHNSPQMPPSLRPSLFQPRASPWTTRMQTSTFASPEFSNPTSFSNPLSTLGSITTSKSKRRNPFERLSATAFDDFVDNVANKIKLALEPPPRPPSPPASVADVLPRHDTSRQQGHPDQDVFGAVQSVESRQELKVDEGVQTDLHFDDLAKASTLPVNDSSTGLLFLPSSETDGETQTREGTYDDGEDEQDDDAFHETEQDDDADFVEEEEQQFAEPETTVQDDEFIDQDNREIDGEFLDSPRQSSNSAPQETFVSQMDENSQGHVTVDQSQRSEISEKEIQGFLSQLAQQAVFPPTDLDSTIASANDPPLSAAMSEDDAEGEEVEQEDTQDDINDTPHSIREIDSETLLGDIVVDENDEQQSQDEMEHNEFDPGDDFAYEPGFSDHSDTGRQSVARSDNVGRDSSDSPLGDSGPIDDDIDGFVQSRPVNAEQEEQEGEEDREDANDVEMIEIGSSSSEEQEQSESEAGPDDDDDDDDDDERDELEMGGFDDGKEQASQILAAEHDSQDFSEDDFDQDRDHALVRDAKLAQSLRSQLDSRDAVASGEDDDETSGDEDDHEGGDDEDGDDSEEDDQDEDESNNEDIGTRIPYHLKGKQRAETPSQSAHDIVEQDEDVISDDVVDDEDASVAELVARAAKTYEAARLAYTRQDVYDEAEGASQDDDDDNDNEDTLESMYTTESLAELDANMLKTLIGVLMQELNDFDDAGEQDLYDDRVQKLAKVKKWYRLRLREEGEVLESSEEDEDERDDMEFDDNRNREGSVNELSGEDRASRQLSVDQDQELIISSDAEEDTVRTDVAATIEITVESPHEGSGNQNGMVEDVADDLIDRAPTPGGSAPVSAELKAVDGDFPATPTSVLAFDELTTVDDTKKQQDSGNELDLPVNERLVSIENEDITTSALTDMPDESTISETLADLIAGTAPAATQDLQVGAAVDDIVPNQELAEPASNIVDVLTDLSTKLPSNMANIDVVESLGSDPAPEMDVQDHREKRGRHGAEPDEVDIVTSTNDSAGESDSLDLKFPVKDAFFASAVDAGIDDSEASPEASPDLVIHNVNADDEAREAGLDYALEHEQISTGTWNPLQADEAAAHPHVFVETSSPPYIHDVVEPGKWDKSSPLRLATGPPSSTAAAVDEQEMLSDIDMDGIGASATHGPLSTPSLGGKEQLPEEDDDDGRMRDLSAQGNSDDDDLDQAWQPLQKIEVVEHFEVEIHGDLVKPDEVMSVRGTSAAPETDVEPDMDPMAIEDVTKVTAGRPTTVRQDDNTTSDSFKVTVATSIVEMQEDNHPGARALTDQEENQDEAGQSKVTMMDPGLQSPIMRTATDADLQSFDRQGDEVIQSANFKVSQGDTPGETPEELEAHRQRDIAFGHSLQWQADTPPYIEEDDEPHIELDQSPDENPPPPFPGTPAEYEIGAESDDARAESEDLASVEHVPAYVRPQTLDTRGPEERVAPIEREMDVQPPIADHALVEDHAHGASRTPRSTTPLGEPFGDSLWTNSQSQPITQQTALYHRSTTPPGEPPATTFDQSTQARTSEPLVQEGHMGAIELDPIGTTPPSSPDKNDITSPAEIADDQSVNEIPDELKDCGMAQHQNDHVLVEYSASDEVVRESLPDEDGDIGNSADAPEQDTVEDEVEGAPSSSRVVDLADETDAVGNSRDDEDMTESARRAEATENPPHTLVNRRSGSEENDIEGVSETKLRGPSKDDEDNQAPSKLATHTRRSSKLEPPVSIRRSKRLRSSSPAPELYASSSDDDGDKIQEALVISSPVKRAKFDYQASQQKTSSSDVTRLAPALDSPARRTRNRTGSPVAVPVGSPPRRSQRLHAVSTTPKRQTPTQVKPSPSLITRGSHPHQQGDRHAHRHQRSRPGSGPTTRNNCANVKLRIQSLEPKGKIYIFSVPGCALVGQMEIGQQAMQQWDAKVVGQDDGELEGQVVGGGGIGGEIALEDDGEDVVPDADVRDALRRIIGLDLWHEGAIELLQTLPMGRK